MQASVSPFSIPESLSECRPLLLLSSLQPCSVQSADLHFLLGFPLSCLRVLILSLRISSFFFLCVGVSCWEEMRSNLFYFLFFLHVYQLWSQRLEFRIIIIFTPLEVFSSFVPFKLKVCSEMSPWDLDFPPRVIYLSALFGGSVWDLFRNSLCWERYDLFNLEFVFLFFLCSSAEYFYPLFCFFLLIFEIA